VGGRQEGRQQLQQRLLLLLKMMGRMEMTLQLLVWQRR
jgi:hypothetical protein